MSETEPRDDTQRSASGNPNIHIVQMYIYGTRWLLLVGIDIRDGTIRLAELHVGNTTIRLAMSEPRPMSDASRLERIERELNDIVGGVSPLFLLWIGASQYERIFLNLLVKKGRITVPEVLDAFRAEGLKHSTGRILAGVTGAISKKLKGTGITDLWISDYDGDVRRWTLNGKYVADAREAFKD
jgi:hypothetical protein